MRFPDTRPTLIRRIAESDDPDAWGAFFDDYWRPVVAFARRVGNLSEHDAEDVASATMVVLFSKGLLARWNAHPVAKLRTLIASVARRVMANRSRVLRGRGKIERDRRESIRQLSFVVDVDEQDAEVEPDSFYSDWLSGLLARCSRELIGECFRDGRNRQVRVLRARLCEGLTVREVAARLKLAPSTVDRIYAQLRDELRRKLESAIRNSVVQYTPPEQVADEFRREWDRAAEHLDSLNLVEQALRECDDAESEEQSDRQELLALISGVARSQDSSEE